ncbi:MAG: hypothetical protein EYC62_07260 [Alphaproteobacteria bacterium]|nr:MAG: hypothetical protein EYC62_07260 [Alphaproteobacteria bacterium]
MTAITTPVIETFLSSQRCWVENFTITRWLDSKQRNPGDVAPDNTVYAGISPATYAPMFIMPDDYPELVCWGKAIQIMQTMERQYGYLGSKQTSVIQLNNPHNDDGGWRMGTREEVIQVLATQALQAGFKSDGKYLTLSEFEQESAISILNHQHRPMTSAVSMALPVGDINLRFLRTLPRCMLR